MTYEDHMALERETVAFKKALPSLLNEEGKFAVVFGDNLLGVYDSYEDALKKGYEVAKLEPFLVKKISAIETIAHFTRDLRVSCPTSH